MFIRVLVILIIVLVGAAFLSPSNPYTDKITNPLVKGLKEIRYYFRDELDIPVPVEKTMVYKWQDKDGKWQFSNTKPSKDVASKIIIYKDDVNIMPATKTKTEE